jgi:hypothetical protein
MPIRFSEAGWHFALFCNQFATIYKIGCYLITYKYFKLDYAHPCLITDKELPRFSGIIS